MPGHSDSGHLELPGEYLLSAIDPTTIESEGLLADTQESV